MVRARQDNRNRNGRVDNRRGRVQNRRGRIDHRLRRRPDHDNRQRQRQRDDYYRDYETNSINTYESSIRDGPTFICISCGGLFFPKSITIYEEEDILDIVGPELLETICQTPSGDEIILCKTCDRDASKEKVPRLCLANGLAFPVIPLELRDLTILEERLVSPRLPFMQIRELGVDKQFGIKGNVVNVPIEIDKCMNTLPRTFDRTETIQLLLKRMRMHKSTYLTDCVRPAVVMSAARYLAKQPLYLEEGIKLSNDWFNNYDRESVPFVADQDDLNNNETLDDEEDNWDETNHEDIAPGSEETMIKQNIVFAPGEGVRPISLLCDEFAEELAFPTKFCGQKRIVDPSIKLSLTDIQKSELRRFDRRSCKVPILFYMLRKKEALTLKNAISIHLRKGNQKSGLNAGLILSTDIIDQFLQTDEAYKVLVQDRSSPPYWQAKLRDTMAMIAQLGPPDLFMTLSAAETRWPELLVILVKVLENRSITEEQALELTYPEKCELIRRDPVTCSRYFDHRFRELFKLLKSTDGPFKEYKLIDWYVRIEFQHRGSPHAHCLLWLEGAPKFDPLHPQYRAVCEQFVDRFISCSTDDSALNELTSLQYHKHSKSCRRFKNDSPICRFGVPHFPMSRTQILDPIDPDSLTQKQLVILEDILESIEDKITEIDTKNRQIVDKLNITFEAFLNELQITEQTYILAVRLTLKRSAIFIRRQPNELRINGYNSDILQRHRANMDIQFVLDPYACVHYMLNYINKANRGMSALLRHVVDECTSGYVSHRQKLYRVGSTFLNCSEISAQEAAYILLSMPLSISSRGNIFINTGEPEKRTKVLKSRAELQEMDPDCEDIMVAGLLEQYPQRPNEMEDICLAEFAALYNVSKTKKQEQSLDSDGNVIPLEIAVTRTNVLKLRDGKGWVIKRRRPRVIRFRKYSVDKDPDNYFREKALLFIPWRDESRELIGVDCRQLCLTNRDLIIAREKQYRHNLNTDYDKIREEVETQVRASDDPVSEDIDIEHAVYDLQRLETSIGDEFGASVSNNNKSSTTFLGPPKYTDDYFAEQIRCLNHRQRIYLMSTMNLVKSSSSPIYHFVTGGAGTGKSLLISVLFQAMTRYFQFKYQIADKVTVALLASTGKAAHNIGGTTIHAFLGITVSANNQLQILSPDTRNTLRTRLWYLKALIIDEISMVGAATFRKIDNQLKQIFESKEPFGGISILAFGDFNQLRPVMDRYIFEEMPGIDHAVLAGPILWHLFSIYRLTEVMRQKDDLAFANALNHLSIGELTLEDRQLFESRLFDKSSPMIPSKAIRLFAQNSQVDRYNRKAIVESTEIGYECLAHDFTTAGLSRQIRDKALYSVSFLDTKDTYGLPKTVLLKKGIRYMITINLDIADGLVNGTSGVLREIDLISVNNQPTPQTIFMEFNSYRVGMNARSRCSQRQFDDKYLTPICRATRDIRTKCGHSFVLVSRQQFPLVPAEAITIHKAQGQTYNEVAIDVSRPLQLSHLYTALSRAKTSKGLYLVGTDFQEIKAKTPNDRCVRELERMESKSIFTTTRSHLDIEIDPRSVKFIFHNFPHLAKHANDIISAPEYMAAHVLVFVETRSFDVILPGVQLVTGLQAKDKRPFGMAVYIRQDMAIHFQNIKSDVILIKGAHIEYLVFKINHYLVLALYASPGMPKAVAIEKIAQVIKSLQTLSSNIVVMGDFNININEQIGASLLAKLSDLGLQFALTLDTPSNDYGNQIDLVFSSFKLTFAGYYESILSDHKLINIVT